MSSVDFSDALWRKSSYSNGQVNSVEVAHVGHSDGLVAVRDSKAPAHRALTFAPPAWRQFADTLKTARTVPPRSAWTGED